MNEALQTAAAPTQNSFKPTANDWRADSVNIHIYLSQHQTNFQFKFEFQSNGGNNIYIDDINIDNGTYTGMNEFSRDMIDMNIFPNPMNNSSTLSFNLPEDNFTTIDVYDVLGNKVLTLDNKLLNAGIHYYQLSRNDFNASGSYFIRITSGEFSFVKQFMVE